MTREKLPKNDGWTDVAYDLGFDPEDSARISKILNEACHVFRHHASGRWKSEDKDAYARLLMEEIRRRPSLVGRLLNTDDRVVKMVTHRAVELLKAEHKASPQQALPIPPWQTDGRVGGYPPPRTRRGTASRRLIEYFGSTKELKSWDQALEEPLRWVSIVVERTPAAPRSPKSLPAYASGTAFRCSERLQG